MAFDEVVEVGASNKYLPSDLTENDPTLITPFLELAATNAQLFAHLLAGQVLVDAAATDT